MMFDKKTIKPKRAVLTGLIAVIAIGVLFFLLRGPYLSNSIKRVIIPVIENATGERVLIDKAVINLFPFYLQTKGFKMFDKEGNRLLWITKTRIYIDMLGLITRKISVRRLTVKEPDLTANKEELEKIRYNIKKYLSAGGGKRFRISLKNIKLTNGNFLLKGAERLRSISGKGLYVDASVKNTITVGLSLKEGILHLQDLSEMKYGLEGRVKIDDGRVEIPEVKLYSSDSTLEAKGELLLSPEGRVIDGDFSADAKIFMDTISELFGLKLKKEGVMSVSGSISLFSKENPENTKWPEIKLNLDAKGWFYLESLMKILKVHNNITGRITVDGKFHGTFPEVLGEGKAKLEDGVLGPLSLDDVVGELKYENRRFTLNNFTAHTYDGELKGDAYILVPGGDYFVNAGVSDVSSPDFFKFIRWDAPFPEGRISGNFQLNKVRGRDIEVTAGVNYLNTSMHEGGPIERLKSIKGGIDFRNNIVKLKDSVLSTEVSALFMDGSIDLKQKRLALDIELESMDASDLTLPSFNGLKAPVRFTGEVNGLFRNPEISGNLELGSGSFNDLLFTGAAADLTYRVSSLSVGLLRVNHEESTYDVSGTIAFRKAKELFAFDNPFYRGSIVLKNGNAKSLIKALYKDIPVSGFVNGEVFLEGKLNSLTGRGDLLVKDGIIYGQQFDKVIIKSILNPKSINFQSVAAYKGNSSLRAKGTLFFDERFNVSASSSGINSGDIFMLHDYPVDALFSLEIYGSGTLKKPHLKFSMDVLESSFRGVKIGKGEINGELKNRELLVRGTFLDGIVSANAGADFSKTTSWTLDLNFKKGRYDSLLASFLRESSQDISASIEGTVRLKAVGENISMQSKFSFVNFSIYGYNFRNSGDIALELVEKELRIRSFSLIGDNADMSAEGVVKIGKDFNVAMKGNLDFAPLRAVSDRIVSLRGRGDFFFDISGSWEAPDVIGEINIRGATASLAGFPYRIGPLNGKIFFKKERLTFKSLKVNFAGGTVVMSGAGYLKKLSLKRLFVSSTLSGIKLRPVEGMSTTFDGKLFYETSSKGSSLTGDINIKKAKYEKRVEWKSRLLRLKEAKKSTVEQPTFLGKTALNVRITGSDDISIDNNVARTPVKVYLALTGSVARYGLIGKIETKEGSIYFRSNEFKIIDGRIDFVEANSIAPVFHIRAETSTGGYRIKLNLDGSINRFTLSIFSDPPLAEMDILTLLTAGQVTKAARGFESGIAASEATAILTGELQEAVEKKFKHITGFERFEVVPQATAAGAVSPRVTVGKRLLEDKLFVVYSTSIGTTEENIIKLEYNLGKNISILGSRDEIGSTGVDIKYRFEFR